MTVGEYHVFRQCILAHTTGANIHAINNLLGILCGAIEQAAEIEDKNSPEFIECELMAVEALRRIRSLLKKPV